MIQFDPAATTVTPAPTASPLAEITVAEGDGIGPEIMEATLRMLDAAGARLRCVPISVGAKVYARGQSSGIESAAWESLRRCVETLRIPTFVNGLGRGCLPLVQCSPQTARCYRSSVDN